MTTPTQAQIERDQLYGYVNGLLGLLQLVRGRDDMPPAIAEALRTNHRVVDAAAYLTQITATAQVGEQEVAKDYSRWMGLANQGVQIEFELRKELLTIEAATIERCQWVVNDLLRRRWPPLADEIIAALDKLKDEKS